MTPWQVAGIMLGLLAYAVAWIWGGRPERQGAGVLLVFFMISSITFEWHIDGFFLPSMIEDGVLLVIFGRLCFRSDRWWPLVVTGVLGLMFLTYVVQLLNPAFSQAALASAHVGLGYVLDLTVLLSVFERLLAGEPPAGRAAWAAAARATAARRNPSAGRPKAAGKDGGRSGRGEPPETLT